MIKQSIKILPTYEELVDVLHCETHLSLPAELHGYLCGVVCGSHFSKAGENFKTILSLLKEELAIDVDAYQSVIARLIVQVFHQLQSEDFSFQLLLPTDEYDLRIRAEALVKWNRVFLSGLGFSGITQKEIEKELVLEALVDISEIARADYDSIMDQEQEMSENVYTELVEYVKVAVMLIYTENVQSKMMHQQRH